MIRRLMSGVVATCLMVVFLSFTPSSVVAQLSGDQEAISLVHRMLDRVGGQGRWAQARTIYVELLGRYSAESDPWLETYWIDLEVPRGRYEIQAGESRRVIAWTAAGGWESRDGVVEPHSVERLGVEQAYWARELTVMFRRLASGTPASRLELESASNGRSIITVFDAGAGEDLSQLVLNPTAEPLRWSAMINDERHERVLGPLEEYDGIRIPKWGATPSGVWRYEHLTVRLSPEPPPVSFEPPR